MGGGVDHLVQDPWLTERIGRDTYRLNVTEALLGTQGDDGRARLAALQQHPVFIYAKVPPDFAAGLLFLRQRGFDLVDTNVTFEKPVLGLHPSATGCVPRFAVPQDREAVMDLARRSFHCSRFHLDPAIPRRVSDRIKADWAGNYFDGKRGDRMVVAEVDARVVGFTQLLHARDETLIIDLIAVDERQRRRGVAREMIAFAETQSHAMHRVRVGTQLANTPSIRLYENLGFRFIEAAYVFHYHHKAGH